MRSANGISRTADYIVVGGGLAGCAVATRLSEDPGTRVLLLEAGGENTHENSYYSSGARSMWEGETNWHMRSTPQRELGNRIMDHPRGRLIGGSAAINVGSWSRGIPADYDAWESDGAMGWGWTQALSSFLRIEASGRADGGLRGQCGPLRLEDTPVGSSMTEIFRAACQAAGLGVTADHNGRDFGGFDRWETIFPGGRRRNSAEAYLAPARNRENLAVVTDAIVTRIVTAGSRAIAVDLEVGGEIQRISASREVLLCAGAFKTPQLLMLSGIGPADHLRDYGITVVADVPGVGENLIDHLNTSIGGSAASGGVAPVHPDPRDPEQMRVWRHTGYGPLSVTANTAIAFVRSRADLDHPDIELLFGINPPATLPGTNGAGGFSIVVANVHPGSRGRLSLASVDPRDTPAIDFRYLSHPDDLPAMIGGVRQAMAVAATASLAPYNTLRDYERSASDADIADRIRSGSGTMYHPVGTARMGAATDPMAVLNPKLQVRGVEGLRVLDASSMPGTVRGHTMAPVLYVAERGCELIQQQRS